MHFSQKSIWRLIDIYFIKTVLANQTTVYFISNLLLGVIALRSATTTFCYTLLLIFYYKFSKVASMVVLAFRSGIGQISALVMFIAIIIWNIARVIDVMTPLS